MSLYWIVLTVVTVGIEDPENRTSASPTLVPIWHASVWRTNRSK